MIPCEGIVAVRYLFLATFPFLFRPVYPRFCCSVEEGYVVRLVSPKGSNESLSAKLIL